MYMVLLWLIGSLQETDTRSRKSMCWKWKKLLANPPQVTVRLFYGAFVWVGQHVNDVPTDVCLFQSFNCFNEKFSVEQRSLHVVYWYCWFSLFAEDLIIYSFFIYTFKMKNEAHLHNVPIFNLNFTSLSFLYRLNVPSRT